MKFFFFGIIFLAFGLGVTLNQLTENMVSGFWFLGGGFVSLVIASLTNEFNSEGVM